MNPKKIYRKESISDPFWILSILVSNYSLFKCLNTLYVGIWILSTQMSGCSLRRCLSSLSLLVSEWQMWFVQVFKYSAVNPGRLFVLLATKQLAKTFKRVQLHDRFLCTEWECSPYYNPMIFPSHLTAPPPSPSPFFCKAWHPSTSLTTHRATYPCGQSTTVVLGSCKK